jgi:glucan phosphoethanolaminetransferase (alkaline phosphatase superfamily)
VVVTALAISVVFAIFVWFIGLRDVWRRGAAVVCATSLLAVAALQWLSSATLPNEYEPLHQFLAGWSVLFAALTGIELARAWLPARSRERTAAAGGALAGVLWTAISGIVLARSESQAWILWGQTAASRYITQRWTFLSARTTAARPDGTLTIGIKPNLETLQTKAWRRKRAAAPVPHIVLFAIDSLRPDHMGTFGYRRHPTTPHIDAMAKQGVVFTRAFSSYPSTANFNSSLLVGRYLPYVKEHRLPRSYQKLALTRLLKNRGYYTLVSSWFEHSAMDEFNPKDYEIDGYVPKPTRQQRLRAKVMPFVPVERDLDHVALHLREARQKNLPVLLWMHLLGAHPLPRGGFSPSKDHPFGDTPSDRYDSAVAGTERWLARVQQMMAALDDGRPIIWFIYADHGIRIQRRGRDLYRGLVHVPLIAVGPDFRPGRVNHPVDTSLDLAATVVDLTGTAPPDEYDGISLIPLLLKGDAVTGMDSRLIPLTRGNDWRGAVYGRFKLLEHKGSRSLFDMRADPEEKRNVIARHEALAARLSDAMNAEVNRRFNDYERALRESP